MTEDIYNQVGWSEHHVPLTPEEYDRIVKRLNPTLTEMLTQVANTFGGHWPSDRYIFYSLIEGIGEFANGRRINPDSKQEGAFILADILFTLLTHCAKNDLPIVDEWLKLIEKLNKKA